MMGDPAGSRAREGTENYPCRLRLFVVGGEPNSMIAQANLSMLSRESLPGCVVEVLDVATNFEEALKERVLVTPTLIVETETSGVRILGNLADKAAVLAALGIRAGATA